MAEKDCATVIGADVTITGEIVVKKGIRIDGNVEGKVKTDGHVMLGKSGTVNGAVHAGTFVAEGTVEGTVFGNSVEIKASAMVEGDLNAGRLVIEQGATFEGRVSVNPSASVPDALDADDDALPAPVAARLSNIPEAVGAGNGNGNGH